LRHQSIHFASKFVHRSRNRRPPRIDDDVPFRRNFGQSHPQSFSNPALHAVPENSLSESPGNGESQPRSLVPIALHPQTKGGKASSGKSLPFVIRFAEVDGSQNPGGLRKAEASRRTERLSRR
jgi:hypothetical protein